MLWRNFLSFSLSFPKKIPTVSKGFEQHITLLHRTKPSGDIGFQKTKRYGFENNGREKSGNPSYKEINTYKLGFLFTYNTCQK